MLVGLSTRRLRLCLAVVSACILLPTLGMLLFYDKGAAFLLSREVLISKKLNTEAWQQQTAADEPLTELQQMLTEQDSSGGSAAWKNQSKLDNLWLETAQDPIVTTAAINNFIAKTTTHGKSKNLIQAATKPPSITKDNLLHRLQSLPIQNKPSASHKSSKTIKNKKKSHVQRRPPEYSYILALDYWDQQTSALRNLLSLQCWAGHFGYRNMFVVEPFVINSRFGALPTTEKEKQHQVTFQDLFDIEQWKETYLKHRYGKSFAHLSPWSEFTAKASRKAILVSIGYTRYGRNCSKEFTNDLRSQCSAFLSEYKFQIIREVCIDSVDIVRMTTKEFDTKVFGNLPYSRAMTVIFSQWRGIDEDRINLIDSHCVNGIGFVDVALRLRTSKRVIDDMKKYIRTYYGQEQVYTAVVVRLEKLIINGERGQEVSSVQQCLHKIFGKWSRFRMNFRLKFTFLAMDYGKFGSAVFSMSYASQITSNIAESVESFLRSIYGEEMTREKWEESFENVTNVSNSGYIALMQSTIAARAKCIILAGAGTFQDHTLHLYKQIPRLDQCFIQLNEKCHVVKSSIPKPSPSSSVNHMFES